MDGCCSGRIMFIKCKKLRSFINIIKTNVLKICFKQKKMRFIFFDPDTRIGALVDHVFAELQASSPGTSNKNVADGKWVRDKFAVKVHCFDPDFGEQVRLSQDQRVEHLIKYRVKLIEK
jgi:hypothetical protein